MSELVLVTGGTGFLGSHCIAALLRAGHRVRTTVRDLDRAAELRGRLDAVGLDGSSLDVVAADLLTDSGWDAAASGCTSVLHVASPFPTHVPKDPDELVRPAREGTLRVMRAASAAGVRRVVLTSSIAAVSYGHPPRATPFTEHDWTRLDGPIPVPPYPVSKTLAERAAWDAVAAQPDLELAVVNPGMIFGPSLGGDRGTSVAVIDRLLHGMPGAPKVSLTAVDVRDVADLHVLAMTHPDAAGQRFLAVCDGPPLTMLQIGAVLRQTLGERARKVPTRELPDWVVRLAGRFDPGIGQITHELGAPKSYSNAKARRVLGWTPRPAREAILAAVP